MDGYINFQCNNTGKELDFLEFYLYSSYPDLQSPDIESWYLINSYDEDLDNYSYVINSKTIPDSDSWYFITRAVDKVQNEIFDVFDVSFAIQHFHDSISFNYLGKDNRINQYSHIGILTSESFKWHILSMNVYVNFENEIKKITEYPILFNEIALNHDLIDLEILSDWIENRELSDGEFNLNFIIEANFSFGPEFPYYLYNYTLSEVTLDLLGPEMVLYEKGVFPGTYSFETDLIGQNPSGWDVLEMGGSVSVLSELNNHSHVVEIFDSSNQEALHISNIFS